VISAELIRGTTVGRAEEESFKLGRVGLDPERDPDEAAGEIGGTAPRKANDTGLDRSIPEIEPRQDRDGLDVALDPIALLQAYRAAPAVGHHLGIDVAEIELPDRV
jgi:hypothetical protein